MHEYFAELVRVVDGDTLKVKIDLGFSIHTVQTLRLAGIDAPERHTEKGKVVKQYLIDRLAPGVPLLVKTTKGVAVEKYGRYLAEVWYGATHINTELVTLGLAVPYSGDGPRL